MHPDISRRTVQIRAPAFDVINARASALARQGAAILSLGQAVPDFGPPAIAIVRARESLEEDDTHYYSADAGRMGLRVALTEALRQHHEIDVVPEEVVITAGGNQAFMLAVMTLLDPGDDVLLPEPYFTNHQMALCAAGVVPLEVPLRHELGFALTWEDLQPRVTARTRAVVLCNPSNPTGAAIEAEEGRRIVAELAARQILVISDEAYMHFVYGREHWSAASYKHWRQNVVVTGTFSKSFGLTGWRVGYMLAHVQVCEEATKIQDAMIICAPVIGQKAAEAAIRENWGYPLSFHASLLARRQIVLEGLDSISIVEWHITDGGLFAFIKVDGCTDSMALAQDVLEHAHVVTIPGAIFGRSGEGFLRLSYGSLGEGQLREAVARLGNYFMTRSPQ